MKSRSKQLTWFAIVGVTIFVLGYSFRLMFVYGSRHKYLAGSNRVRTQVLHAKRGVIKDRNGEILAQDILDKKGEYTRRYTGGEAFGHLIGYTIEKSGGMTNNKNCAGQRGGLVQNKSSVVRVGSDGLESSLDCILSGVDGIEYFEVDSSESKSRYLDSVNPKDGDDVILTIDSRLQRKTYDHFEGVVGATIVMDAKTSEVLAIVSNPSYESGKITQGGQIDKYLEDKRNPLFNRATLGEYPPGSIFKMVVASAALQEGKITKDETVLDTGYKMVGNKKYNNWLYTEYGGRTDGEVDIVKALKRSNDIYFYEIGKRLDVELLARYANDFGFGSKVGIELSEEEGVVPTAFWKEEVIGDKWFLGDTYNYSIGQGFLLVTPLQVAHMTQAIANRNSHCSPTLLGEEVRNSGKVSIRKCSKVPVSDEVIDLITRGMIEACAVKGTAWTFFDLNSPSLATTSAGFVHYKDPIKVACKTGTAEHFVDGNEEPHGWFTLFAPAEDPQIIITVLAEKGGQGSDSAGTIARKVLDSSISLGLIK